MQSSRQAESSQSLQPDSHTPTHNSLPSSKRWLLWAVPFAMLAMLAVLVVTISFAGNKSEVDSCRKIDSRLGYTFCLPDAYEVAVDLDEVPSNGSRSSSVVELRDHDFPVVAIRHDYAPGRAAELFAEQKQEASAGYDGDDISTFPLPLPGFVGGFAIDDVVAEDATYVFADGNNLLTIREDRAGADYSRAEEIMKSIKFKR